MAVGPRNKTKRDARKLDDESPRGTHPFEIEPGREWELLPAIAIRILPPKSGTAKQLDKLAALRMDLPGKRSPTLHTAETSGPEREGWEGSAVAAKQRL